MAKKRSAKWKARNKGLVLGQKDAFNRGAATVMPQTGLRDYGSRKLL
jgi:hypothetical protein